MAFAGRIVGNSSRVSPTLRFKVLVLKNTELIFTSSVGSGCGSGFGSGSGFGLGFEPAGIVIAFKHTFALYL